MQSAESIARALRTVADALTVIATEIEREPSPRSTGSTTPRAVSVREAARLLGCSEKHVRRLAGRGEVRVLRVGRRILISLAEIERLTTRDTA